jgi:hypothetical protein
MNDLPLQSSRTGKIARLPRKWREELNQRLADGDSGPALVEWLNAEPEVQAMLAKKFGGRAITEQNLSAWRQGGFLDWQRREEGRAWMEESIAESGEIVALDEGRLSDRAATVSLLAMMQVLRETPPDASPAEKCKVAFAIAQVAAQWKNAETLSSRNALAWDKWHVPRQAAAQEQARELTQEEKVARLQQIFAVL